MDAHAPRGTKSNATERMGTASALCTQVSGEVTQLVWLGDAGQEMGWVPSHCGPDSSPGQKRKYLGT